MDNESREWVQLRPTGFDLVRTAPFFACSPRRLKDPSNLGLCEMDGVYSFRNLSCEKKMFSWFLITWQKGYLLCNLIVTLGVVEKYPLMPVNGHAEEASVGGTSHEVPPSWHLIGPLPRPIHWREHLQGFKGVKPYVIPISNRSRTIRSLFVSAPPPGAFSRQGRWGVAESRNESESELCTDAVSPSHLPPRASRGRRGRGGGRLQLPSLFIPPTTHVAALASASLFVGSSALWHLCHGMYESGPFICSLCMEWKTLTRLRMLFTCGKIQRLNHFTEI